MGGRPLMGGCPLMDVLSSSSTRNSEQRCRFGVLVKGQTNITDCINKPAATEGYKVDCTKDMNSNNTIFDPVTIGFGENCIIHELHVQFSDIHTFLPFIRNIIPLLQKTYMVPKNSQLYISVAKDYPQRNLIMFWSWYMNSELMGVFTPNIDVFEFVLHSMNIYSALGIDDFSFNSNLSPSHIKIRYPCVSGEKRLPYGGKDFYYDISVVYQKPNNVQNQCSNVLLKSKLKCQFMANDVACRVNGEYVPYTSIDCTHIRDPTNIVGKQRTKYEIQGFDSGCKVNNITLKFSTTTKFMKFIDEGIIFKYFDDTGSGKNSLDIRINKQDANLLFNDDHFNVLTANNMLDLFSVSIEDSKQSSFETIIVENYIDVQQGRLKEVTIRGPCMISKDQLLYDTLFKTSSVRAKCENIKFIKTALTTAITLKKEIDSSRTKYGDGPRRNGHSQDEIPAATESLSA
ncbi:unnamed protein product, partial [Didymodactylos carnosus]